MNRDERKKYADEYVRINRRFEKAWFPKVKKALKSKVSSLIARLRSGGISAGRRWISEDTGNEKLEAVISDLYTDVGLRHARRNEIRMRKEAKGREISMEYKRIGYADTWTEWIQNYLRTFLLEKITYKVDETTKEKLLNVLDDAVEQGLGIDEIVARLESPTFNAKQAATIVRTEVNRASNAGVYAQGVTFEYELQKGWSSLKDRRTRGVDPKDHADHFHMDGQIVDFFDVFRDPRNGHELQHPGDPKAAAEDTVLCRCVMWTQPKRDDKGRMIPKKSRVSVILPGQIRRPRTITV